MESKKKKEVFDSKLPTILFTLNFGGWGILLGMGGKQCSVGVYKSLTKNL